MRFWLRLDQERVSTRSQIASPPSVDVREVPSERAVIRRAAVRCRRRARSLDYPCLAGLIESMEVSVSESAPQGRIDHSAGLGQGIPVK